MTSDYASTWVNNIHPVLIVESTSDGPIHSPDIDVRTSDYASIWVNNIHPVLIVESTSDGPIHSPSKDVLHSAKGLCLSMKITSVVVVVGVPPSALSEQTGVP